MKRIPMSYKYSKNVVRWNINTKQCKKIVTRELLDRYEYKKVHFQVSMQKQNLIVPWLAFKNQA